MGIQKHGIELIFKAIDLIEKKPINIMDWGNSYMRAPAIKWLKENGHYPMAFDMGDEDYDPIAHIRTAKNGTAWVTGDYFSGFSSWYNYTSIDLNGKEYSIKIDLRKPIPEEFQHFMNAFDLLIDSGTSEHVDNQYSNWKNLHDVTAVGGYRVHILPMIGYWQGHCKYKYNMEFFKELAEVSGYKVISLFEHLESEFRGDVCCILQKTSDSDFISEDAFNKLPLHVESGSVFNDRMLYGYAYD